MDQMFSVRSAASAPPASRYTRRARSISPPTSHHASPTLAVCTRFQPAACLGRLKCDQHGRDVLRAQSRLLPRHLPDANRHARSMSPLTSHHASPRLAGCTSFQSAARLGRLGRDQHARDVPGAQRCLCLRTTCPTPHLASCLSLGLKMDHSFLLYSFLGRLTLCQLATSTTFMKICWAKNLSRNTNPGAPFARTLARQTATRHALPPRPPHRCPRRHLRRRPRRPPRPRPPHHPHPRRHRRQRLTTSAPRVRVGCAC